MRKPAFFICENKGTDQLPDNCPADQRLSFRYMDITTTITLLRKSEISSIYPSFVPYSLVCVSRGQLHHRQVSHDVAHSHDAPHMRKMLKVTLQSNNTYFMSEFRVL